jgi:nucleoside-diphosphate-sugar epimerase
LSPPAYLLTGYPSFTAKKMCEELLRAQDGSEVFAVVHSKLAKDAEVALGELSGEQRARLHLFDGDAAALDMGLSGVEYKDLARRITHVHHLARVSYSGIDRERAEAVNVGATREVLEFAAACEKLRCVGVHSTSHVAGDRRGHLREDELDCGQSFRNVVEETAARAEKLVRRRQPKVPVCVLRPTTIVGDSRTGEVDRFDGPYLLILLIVTSPPELGLPLPGRANVPLHLVPVDYVVRASRALVLASAAPGRTFHLADPTPCTTRRVFELVAESLGKRTPRGFIPANITRALLRTPGLDRIASSPRAFIETLATPTTLSTTNTDELLGETDIRCPPFESYVDKLVEYVQARLREKRERELEENHDTLA